MVYILPFVAVYSAKLQGISPGQNRRHFGSSDAEMLDNDAGNARKYFEFLNFFLCLAAMLLWPVIMRSSNTQALRHQ
eukprot:SAG31_NODE_34_length_31842_cov_31.677850_5_plen_77_part_00